MVGSIADITEAKVAEQELRLLKTAIDNANDAILITEAEPIDQPGPRVVYSNKAFTRNTGYSRRGHPGQEPPDPAGARDVPGDARQAPQEAQGLAGDPGRAAQLRKDGTEFWVELNIRPVADARGWYTHWVSVQRDITERKREEAARRLRPTTRCGRAASCSRPSSRGRR